MIAVVVLLIASGTEPGAVETQAAWIEINHVIEVYLDKDTGVWRERETLCQVIFWDGVAREKCLAWRLADRVNILPDERGVTVLWHESDVLRKVRAKFYLETWTLDDIEIRHREICAPEFRRGLGRGGEALVPSRLRAKVTR